MVGDPALTELGRRQTLQLAARSWLKVDELWVSELRRARETAAPLAEALGLEPRVFKWMDEIGDPVPAELLDGIVPEAAGQTPVWVIEGRPWRARVYRVTQLAAASVRRAQRGMFLRRSTPSISSLSARPGALASKGLSSGAARPAHFDRSRMCPSRRARNGTPCRCQ